MPVQMNPERMELFRAQTLTASATTTFSKELTLGEGWTSLHLIFNQALTIGTGSGAISEGELQIIQAITLRTDKGEFLCNATPGRFLYKLDQIRSGVLPVKSNIAAATATYYVPINIYFADRRLRSPEKHATILDTSRYGSLTLAITMGGLSNLLTTVGTAALTLTADCYVKRFRGLLPDALKPQAHVEYGVFPPQNPSNQTFIDLEKAANLAYKRLQLFTTSGATAGVPWTGAADDTVITDVDIERSGGFLQQNILVTHLQRENQTEYGYGALSAGLHSFSFVEASKSLSTAFRSGGESRLRFNWRNQATLPATPQVSAGYEALRPLSNTVLR